MDKQFVLNVLVFFRVDMKNILRLIYENVTVLETRKYRQIGKVVPGTPGRLQVGPRDSNISRWDLGPPK